MASISYLWAFIIHSHYHCCAILERNPHQSKRENPNKWSTRAHFTLHQAQSEGEGKTSKVYWFVLCFYLFVCIITIESYLSHFHPFHRLRNHSRNNSQEIVVISRCNLCSSVHHHVEGNTQRCIITHLALVLLLYGCIEKYLPKSKSQVSTSMPLLEPSKVGRWDLKRYLIRLATIVSWSTITSAFLRGECDCSLSWCLEWWDSSCRFSYYLGPKWLRIFWSAYTTMESHHHLVDPVATPHGVTL